MKKYRPLVWLVAALLMLGAAAVPPWGVCTHQDGSTCVEGRDCCNEHGDEPEDGCTTCVDQEPAPASVQARDGDAVGCRLAVPILALADAPVVKIALDKLELAAAGSIIPPSDRSPRAPTPLRC